jgi:hypothetical protein
MWLIEYSKSLLESGVDVILDALDLSLSDDVPRFMKQSVRRAGRVLMICTETYVRISDEGQGGVGYNNIIVTGEMITDF